MSSRLLPFACLLALFSSGTVSCAPPKDPGSDVSDKDQDGNGNTDGDGNSCSLDFDYAAGFPCNSDSDCTEGLSCVSDGMYLLCAEKCGDESDCELGFTCTQAHGLGTSHCFPEPGAPLPFDDGSLGPGSPCFSDLDCADDAVCANQDGSWVCAPPCENSSDCGDCFSCRLDLPNPSGSGHLCAPRTANDIGKPCTSADQCDSSECHGFCTEQCTFTPCPDGTECEDLGGNYRICILPEQRGATQVDDSCWYDFECAGGARCQPSASGGKVCGFPREQGEECELHEECVEGLRCLPNALRTAKSCEPPGGPGSACFESDDCVAGHSCRDFALNHGVCTRDCTEDEGCGAGATCVAAEVDTLLELWDSVDPEWPYIESDDIDYSRGLHWSRIEFEPTESGIFHISVRTLANVGGPYRLSLTRPGFDDPEEEVPVIAEVEGSEGNDAVDTAHKLASLPVLIEGELSTASDRDVYEFEVSELGRIVIETFRGRPSACLASNLVGSIPMGEPCTFHYQCEHGLCDRGLGEQALGDDSLGICSADCSEDMTSCPSGFACMDVETGRACVAQDQLRTKKRGEPCRFTFECDDGDEWAPGICVKLFGEEPFCSSRCETWTCPDSWSCDEVLSRQMGAGELKVEACLPL